SPEDGLGRIQQVMNPLQQEAVKEFVNVPRREAAQAAAIFVGYSKGKPFLAAIETSGAYGFSQLPYFAIGSGDIFANHAMRSVAHFPLEELDQGQAMALAYRTIENTIAAAAIGIGGSVQLLAATPEHIWCLND